MTARAFDVATFVFPDPNQAVQYPSLQPIQANASSSYHLNNFPSIQTLSNNLGNENSDQVRGLLYVPSLSPTDICFNQSAQYVPHNATRRGNIPTTSYTALALAPWFSIECTKSYLASLMDDLDFVSGVLFYQVNDTSTATPPPVSNVMWNLNDGGRWKSRLGIPAYALPGPTGRQLMYSLSMYSGNVSTTPDPAALGSDYGPGGMARLYGDVIIDRGPSLPSLWVFLIIVLAVLLAVVTASSVFLGYIQRRRRNALRRRVVNGEVDLEALGMKTVNVPRTELDKLPLYTYRSEQASSNETAVTSKEAGMTHPDDSVPVSEVPTNQDAGSSHIGPNIPLSAASPPSGYYFSQTSCTICLDEFEPNVTTVRELPCHHIFHPECVDPFLLEHSSVCPVCKRSVLPNGFCPENITNAMVRREQLIRRIQQRRGQLSGRRVSSLPRSQTAATIARVGLSDRIADMRTRLNLGINHPHEAAPTGPVGVIITPIEMTPLPQSSNNGGNSDPAASGHTPATLSSSESAMPTQASTNRASIIAIQSEHDPGRRRDLARQRAIANLNEAAAAVDQDIEQEQRRLPFWRRAVGKVFPGLTT